jgi:hypothetical protein
MNVLSACTSLMITVIVCLGVYRNARAASIGQTATTASPRTT